MTAYTKSTNFATKDTLTSGDPLKIVKGTEINTEFDNIATAVNSKSDTASPTFTGTVTIPTLAYAGTTLTSAVTGTGKMVLDASPTLVTPILGTPTSGILTNCTGINYNGFKNRIINGQITTDQRNAGASQTFTAAAALAYSVDRWYGYCTGANVTGQQVAGANATQFRYRFTGAASVTAVGFGQRIEQKNSYDLAGSTATLSADLAISATLTTVTWTASYATTTADTFGTLASPTVTQIATGTFTVTSTVTNFNAQITIPAAATTGIEIVFTVGALTAGLTWTIGNVQLEKGSTATAFDYRPYGTELALCQRYFWRNKSGGSGASVGVGYLATATIFRGYAQFPVAMRVAPTFTINTDSGNLIINTATGNIAITTIGGTFSTDSGTISLDMGSSGTAGQGAVVYAGGGAANAAYLQFSSEL
jgi:hypothetical protein